MRYFIFFLILTFANSAFSSWKEKLKINPTKAELKKSLTKDQYHITQEDGTERPFKNKYWDNKKAGIYVDIVKGEPLFSSKDKFKSGTGWPSFTKPLIKEHMVYKQDGKLWMKRTEVRSKYSNSHLGHVFDDGPKPAGKRYCINSAALRFIAVKDLKKEGYGEFLKDFEPMDKKVTENKKANKAFAYFAGGCFWCMEPPFEKKEGVYDVISGYSGGKKKNPTYKEVSGGATQHIEAVKVIYNPKKITYPQLLDIFWRQINPTQANGQFVDEGPQYRSAIFYQNENEKSAAMKSLEGLKKLNLYGGKKIVTELTKFKSFYDAEEYHQDYYKKNKIRYKFYRFNSGRDKFLKKIWYSRSKP